MYNNVLVSISKRPRYKTYSAIIVMILNTLSTPRIVKIAIAIAYTLARVSHDNCPLSDMKIITTTTINVMIFGMIAGSMLSNVLTLLKKSPNILIATTTVAFAYSDSNEPAQ